MKTYKKIGWCIAVWMLLGPVHDALAGPDTNTVTGGGTNTVTGTGLKTLTNPLKWNDINSLMNGLLDIVLQLGLVVGVIMIILSGLKFVLAQGNDKKIEDAKHMFFYTVVGIAVIFGAKLLVSVITATINSVKG